MTTSLLRRMASGIHRLMIFSILTGGAALCGWMSAPPESAAAETASPWECSAYSGDAHTRCLQALIEMQQERISKLQGELQSQQSSMNELRDRADRQRAATADLERQLSDRSYAGSSYAPPAPPYYSYTYPPVGLGLYLGSPWYGYGYGYPFYRPFFGPRIYIGPRYFGPRHFGHYRGRW